MDRRGWALQKVAQLCAGARTVTELWDEVNDVVVEAVPGLGLPCWYTVDPASLLITSHYNPAMPELPPEFLALEYAVEDVNQVVDVARSVSGVSTLHDATGGDPRSSPRWQANSAYGGDQELVAALRTTDGQTWGSVGLYRGVGEPLFDDAEKRWVAAAAPHLAEGARRALLLGEAQDPEGVLPAPGLLVLDAGWQVESSTSGVLDWLDDLPDGGGGRLPTAVLTVAGRAMRPEAAAGEVAMARVRGRSGTWIVLHGAALHGPEPRVAVIVEPAHPARITTLLLAAYQLTERERDVTVRVLQGASTQEIARSLFLSPHTVQQHLTSVFGKTGVRSRRDLVTKVFFSHYEPRVRDNEARALDGRPLRGGPC